MHVDGCGGFVTSSKERLPVTIFVVNAWQSEVGRDFAEAHCVNTACCIAANFSGSSYRIPQRNNAQRQHTSARFATPFFDHPVVVRTHAQHGEFFVFGFVESLSAESWERGEAQRSFNTGGVHVFETFFEFVATLTHFVIGDARQDDFIA